MNANKNDGGNAKEYLLCYLEDINDERDYYVVAFDEDLDESLGSGNWFRAAGPLTKEECIARIPEGEPVRFLGE